MTFINTSITVGITGHINLSASQIEVVRPLVKSALINIISFCEYSNGPIDNRVFSSPIAAGADTLFAEIVLQEFGKGLRIILPFEKDEYLKDFKSGESVDQFKKLLDKADQVEVIGSVDQAERDELYENVGRRIVDENQFLIAIWDEEEARGRGGTGEIVAYAQKKGKDVLVINPTIPNPKIEWRYLSGLSNENVFNSAGEAESEDFQGLLFSVYDEKAITNQSEYEKIWDQCFNLGLAAAFLLAISVAFPLSGVIKPLTGVAELIFIFRILMLIKVEKSQSFHENYLRSRYVAERLRLNGLFSGCEIPIPKRTMGVIYRPTEPIENSSPISLSRKIGQLCILTGRCQQQKTEILQMLDAQKDYHEKRAANLASQVKRHHFWTRLLLGVFIAAIIFHVGLEIAEWQHWTFAPIHSLLTVAVFLKLFVPAIVARLEAIKFIKDWERMMKQSEYMKVFFEKSSEEISTVEDPLVLESKLGEIYDNMTQENIDWHLFMTTKKEYTWI
ncbi:hypothetical protein MUK70_19135 [Dyadobacter chenwenxiniae]|uniref:SMODS and SLOG-associating 2TM effector domain-containing protein n=1 Tax=Dyadobacter chenwenxiniae TaxID=2906456 RepID=A0A9X1PMW2_9BACT|nr:hypothetical protein [Dyadobacter chenwenxiniae]MCF0061356.1 hypothetical protein [Dyadobacter chenwenxiniae]UON81178.1 hypothetical protein MUK70_19135 [Dyadobacter chenwenxiniae]